jgi:acetylglutamate kinase
MTITFERTPDGGIISDQHIIARVLSEALSSIKFLKDKILVFKLGGSMPGLVERHIESVSVLRDVFAS